MEDNIKNVVEACEERLDATVTILVNCLKNPINDIIDYLTDKNSDKDLQGLPISPSDALKIMRLYVYGTAYLSINYDCSIGQAPKNCEQQLAFLENLTCKDILDKPIDVGVLNEYIKFKIHSSYILHQRAKENIIDSQLLPEYFKIYPFGIFTMDSILKPLSFKETILLDIINMYNYAFNSFANLRNVSDEAFWQRFNEIVAKRYPEPNHIYQCIIANVYKNMFVSSLLIDDLKEDYRNLVQYIEETPVEMLLFEINDNAKLAMQFLETFYKFNYALSKGMVEETDLYFRQNNDGETLKKISPFNN